MRVANKSVLKRIGNQSCVQISNFRTSAFQLEFV